MSGESEGSASIPRLAKASFECLHCKSYLTLRGRNAQALAESGTCPICHWHGAVTMPVYQVPVDWTDRRP